MSAAVMNTGPTYNLGPLSQIPLGEGRRFQIGQFPVAVFRTRSGGVYATQAVCPHKAGPLADGVIGGATLVCPLHAYKFDLASGQPIEHECKTLKTYPVSVSEAGDILLDLEAGHPVAEEGRGTDQSISEDCNGSWANGHPSPLVAMAEHKSPSPSRNGRSP